MKQLIEFELEDGGTILVEVDAPTPAGVVKAASPSEVITKARETFDAALGKIKPAAESIIAKLRGLHDPPDEIEVEFGLTMNAEAGAFVATAGTEANYKVTLTWKREEKPEKKDKPEKAAASP